MTQVKTRREASAERRQKLEALLALVGEIKEGNNPTAIPFLTFVRRNQPTPHTRAVFAPSFCLVLQGKKRVHFDREVVEYGPGDFAAAVIQMPASGHVADATPKNPYIGLRIELTTQDVASVIADAKIAVRPREKALGPAAFVGRASDDILDLFLKLLRLAQNPQEAAFLSGLVKREMIFRFLTGPYAHLFFQRMLFDKSVDGVGQAIEWIRDNFAVAFKVEDLARSNGLSVSALHHKFKAVTTMGPLQYQKQLRLLEARRLMVGGLKDATTAAFEVGYESVSQFNREYKRLFGLPPLKDIKALGRGVDPGAIENT